MRQAADGDKVKVHYTGTLGDGTVFDSSREREPLEFTLGDGKLIKGFNQAVVGLGTGDSRDVTISAEEAYGQRREELVVKIPKDQFPPNIEPEPGVMLNLRQPDGGVLDVTITEVTDDAVMLDGNHPLAGRDLTFNIELVEIAE